MDYRRVFIPGGTCFFTVVTYRRQPLFDQPAAAILLRQVVSGVKQELPFKMVAWVILPDHLHMIWTMPADDPNYSKRWSKIKATFTRAWLAAGHTEKGLTVGQKHENRRGIWQPRFMEHTIRDADDLAAHIDYIHFNPVKHGHVKYAKDWESSSFQSYVQRKRYPLDWGCVGHSEKPLKPSLKNEPWLE